MRQPSLPQAQHSTTLQFSLWQFGHSRVDSSWGSDDTLSGLSASKTSTGWGSVSAIVGPLPSSAWNTSSEPCWSIIICIWGLTRSAAAQNSFHWSKPAVIRRHCAARTWIIAWPWAASDLQLSQSGSMVLMALHSRSIMFVEQEAGL